MSRSAPSNAQTPSSPLTAGVSAHRAGRLEEAEACYRRVKRRDPDYAEALRLRALIAHQRRAPDTAVKLLRRAVEQQPRNPVYHHSLAGLLRAQGQTWPAIEAYRRAWALQPERVENGLDLGETLAQAGDSEAALAIYTDLATAHPAMLAVHWRIATLLFERGDPDSAAARLEIAQRHVDEAPDTRCRLAAAWASVGAHERARAGYEAVLAIHPDHVGARAGLGSACQALGRFDESTRHFEAALDLDDTQGWVYAALMNNRRYVMAERRLEAMQRCLDDPTLDDHKHSAIHFALGQWHDADRNPEAAFTHFAAGNRLHARRYPFDRAAFDTRIENIRQRCTTDHFARRAGRGDESEKPVLIVGMPRSGTSLVEQIIASHPRAYGAGELTDVARMARELPVRVGVRGRYPRGLERLDAETAAALARRYVGALSARAPGAARVTDKMPFNMFWLGLIASILPHARVVYCRRDPMDTALSCYFQLFSQGLRFAYDLGHIGHVYRQHERLMAHWQAHLPLSMLTVDYETLVREPEAQSRRLIEFTGLDWDERVLDFHRSARAVRTASVWQVRQPVYRSSVARWRAYEPWLGALRTALDDG